MEPAKPRSRGGKAHHSIVEPHLEFIRELRRQRRTWQEIADALAAEKGIRVTLQAPYLYFRRWIRRRGKLHWESSEIALQSTEEGPTPKASKTIPTLPGAKFRKPNRTTFEPESFL